MKYLYEFIGTFFLVFTIGMTVLQPHSAGPLAPIAIGSALAVMIFAGGHVSGGHYNPAVSFAVFLKKKLSLKDLGLYWVAQLLASVVAAFATIYFKGAPNPVASNLDIPKAFLAEFLFTFALCFVVLNVALARANAGNSFYGWAIGFTVLVGAYAVGAISGGAFNPAVALGITILNIGFWSNIWVYVAANLLGGAVAAFIYRSE